MTTIELRHERSPAGSRHLAVHALPDGGLRVEGHDLGAGTEWISDDGEYEWSYVLHADDLPELRRRLGADPTDDLLEHLRRHYIGDASYEFERLTRDLRRSFWSWR
jgi:hypothetical protein